MSWQRWDLNPRLRRDWCLRPLGHATFAHFLSNSAGWAWPIKGLPQMGNLGFNILLYPNQGTEHLQGYENWLELFLKRCGDPEMGQHSGDGEIWLIAVTELQ